MYQIQLLVKILLLSVFLCYVMFCFSIFQFLLFMLQVAKSCFVPVLFGHAIDDDFIHPHHSERIYEAYIVSFPRLVDFLHIILSFL